MRKSRIGQTPQMKTVRSAMAMSICPMLSSILLRRPGLRFSNAGTAFAWKGSKAKTRPMEINPSVLFFAYMTSDCGKAADRPSLYSRFTFYFHMFNSSTPKKQNIRVPVLREMLFAAASLSYNAILGSPLIVIDEICLIDIR